MISSVIASAVMLILSEGCGQWMMDRRQIAYRGYAAPLGAAVLFAVLELVLLPVIFLHLASSWARIAVTAVFIAAVVLFLVKKENVWKSLLRRKTILPLLALAFMTFLLIRFGSIPAEESIRVMIQSAETPHITIQGLEGYDVFGSVLIYYLGGNSAGGILSLSQYGACIFLMMILNIIDSFQLDNRMLRFSLAFFAAFSFIFTERHLLYWASGESWRLIFTSLALFTAWSWMKEKDEQIKFLLPWIFMGGMASDRGFLMISLAIIYCLMVYLLHIQKVRTLYDTASFLIPAVIITACSIGRIHPAAGWMIGGTYALFLLSRKFRKVYHHMIRIENFLIDYNRRIFYMGVPAVFLAGTFVLRFFVPGYEIRYGGYIAYFSSHTVNGFLFPDGSFIDAFTDILRWTGMALFLHYGKSREDEMLKSIFAGMLIFFINPLCMGMLAKLTGMRLYECAFEVLFNPFTDILLVVFLCRKTEGYRWIRTVIASLLIASTLIGHAASWMGWPSGFYTDLTQEVDSE